MKPSAHAHCYSNNFSTGGLVSIAIAASNIRGAVQIEHHPEIAPLDAPQFLPTGEVKHVRTSSPSDPFIVYTLRG